MPWREQQGDLLLRRPFSEWTLTHMSRLLPTAPVRRAPDARPLPGRSRPLDLTYRYGGRDRRLSDLHRRTFTTAFVVLRRGELVHESYPGRFAGPGAVFHVFSLSKAVLSLLVGAALGDGAIGGLGDRVTAYRPDLAGSAYDGPTLAHLLDMSSGAGGAEVWESPGSDIRRFVRAALYGGDLAAVVRSVRRTAAPGERFNYSTLDAQVLAWVVETATGRTLAEYAAERLWRRIGAERDASYGLTRSRPGGAVARGRALGSSGYGHYGYSTLWWTVERGAMTGLGVHGQYLFVDPAAEVVIVKCSAWPALDDEELDRETITALRQIAEALG